MKSKFILLFFLGFLLSCHKDTDIITTDDKPDPTPVLVTTKLVTQNDTTSVATNLASQTFAGQSASYNHIPYLVSEGHLINRDFELIRLETKDHLAFYHVKTLVENDVNYLHWKRPEVTYALAHSTNSSEVNLGPDIKLNLPANSIQHLDGSLYNGTYKIAYSILDPFTSGSHAIPSFIGIRDHQHVALEFAQCIYLNVLSEFDEKLKFSGDASLQIPPTSSQNLWKFNADKSAWVPDDSPPSISGIALDSSLYYAVAVDHPAVRATGTFHLHEKLTPHQQLKILYGNTSRTVYTTNSGKWAAMIPSGIPFTIEASLPCGTTFTKSFIAEENSFDVPLVVNQETCVNTAYSGTMRNNDAEVLNGIIVVSGARPNFYYASDPEFSFNVPTCLGNKNGIRGIDIATGQSGPVIYWEAADSIELFSVFACEEANYEYLSLEVSGDRKMYWDLKTSINQSRLIIEEGVTEGNLDLMVLISGMEVGEYENTELNIAFEDRSLGTRGYSLYCPTSPYGCGFTKFVITHFPATQGQWIRGYFEGEFWIKTFQPLTAGYRPVKGEFQVFRDF